MWRTRRRFRMRWGMLAALMNFLKACWRPASERYGHTGSDAIGRQDGLLWYKDTGQHMCGEFSMAVVQANSLLEDQSQIESGPLSSLESGPHGTFIGIYDGHGGPETSRYINDHLFHHLKSKDLLFFVHCMYFCQELSSFSSAPTGYCWLLLHLSMSLDSSFNDMTSLVCLVDQATFESWILYHYNCVNYSLYCNRWYFPS